MVRVRLLAFVASAFLFIPSFFGAIPSAPSKLTLFDVTVIDVSGGPPRTNMTVVISGGRIEAIGPDMKLHSEMREGEAFVNAHGKFVIPGLWDMHTHIAGINADPSWANQVLLPLLVANGITGIRDMGGDLDALESWRREIERGEMNGPQIVAAGPMLLPARPAGAPAAPADPAVLRIGSPDEARETVDSLQKRGADFIKIIQLPRDAYFAVAAESKRAGIPFVGHIPSRVNAIEASNAGQKSIEHVIYSSLAFDCSSDAEALRKKKSEANARGDGEAVAEITNEANRNFSPEKAVALWKIFRQNGTWVTPTLFSIRANAHHPEDSPDNPQLAFLPAALRKEWTPSKPPSQDDRDTAAWWQRQFENDLKLTGEMHRAGVRLLAGSDSLDRYVFVGTSLHEELRLLVEAGLTPLEALQTATRNPVEFLGTRDFGTIVPGSRADLILLDADPLRDIANTRKISAVILGGKYFSREDLDAMLAKARAAAAAVRKNSQ